MKRRKGKEEVDTLQQRIKPNFTKSRFLTKKKVNYLLGGKHHPLHRYPMKNNP